MSTSSTDTLHAAWRELRDEMVRHRHLIPGGVPGIFGRGFHFEDVLERFGRLVSRRSQGDGAEVVRFPPVMARPHFEKAEYLNTMPQLAGSIWSFTGDNAAHMKLLDAIHEGRDWSEFQTMTNVVLAPAACYPVYPAVAAEGPLAEGGRLFDVLTYCFRNEPSEDPARMQSFRQREMVRVGCDGEEVREWRDGWLLRGQAILNEVGLDVRPEDANDPFFGRTGRMLAANQREQQLKIELVYPITSEEKPTAIMSVNYHQDHFGNVYGIKSRSGQPAHTGCLGFGMERITLALFKTHGMNPAEWPANVRAALGY